jgi:glycosyltransferase involved in cell wall biosynthesis
MKRSHPLTQGSWLAWMSPWHGRGGIQTYSKQLFPAVKEELARHELSATLIRADTQEGKDRSAKDLLEELALLRPKILHIQHEYGHWRGKNPPLYSFPRFVRKARRLVPGIRILATGHTVLPEDYRFAIRGSAVSRAARAAANAVGTPILRHWWNGFTWQPLDQVIVHSELQVATLARTAPRARARCIPHFVPETLPMHALTPDLEKLFAGEGPFLLVFGFITPSKGQDLAIEALAEVQKSFPSARLILAGSPRTKTDGEYEQHCRALAARLGVEGHVSFTGFIHQACLPGLYARASLVLAPFRETTGSGSLATALGYGAALSASDLPLNREIFDRMNEPFEGFSAQTIIHILRSPEKQKRLQRFAQEYASKYSPPKVAALHLEAYRSCFN